MDRSSGEESALLGRRADERVMRPGNRKPTSRLRESVVVAGLGRGGEPCVLDGHVEARPIRVGQPLDVIEVLVGHHVQVDWAAVEAREDVTKDGFEDVIGTTGPRQHVPDIDQDVPGRLLPADAVRHLDQDRVAEADVVSRHAKRGHGVARRRPRGWPRTGRSGRTSPWLAEPVVASAGKIDRGSIRDSAKFRYRRPLSHGPSAPSRT